MSLTEQKVQEVVNELKDWFNKPNAVDFHFKEPSNQMEVILAESKQPKAIKP